MGYGRALNPPEPKATGSNPVGRAIRLACPSAVRRSARSWRATVLARTLSELSFLASRRVGRARSFAHLAKRPVSFGWQATRRFRAQTRHSNASRSRRSVATAGRARQQTRRLVRRSAQREGGSNVRNTPSSRNVAIVDRECRESARPSLSTPRAALPAGRCATHGVRAGSRPRARRRPSAPALPRTLPDPRT